MQSDRTSASRGCVQRFRYESSWAYAIVSASVILISAQGVCDSPSWPQFRGVNSAGVSETGRPPIEFGVQKNVQWKIPLGSGVSSPIVWNDKLFVTTFENGKLYTCCISTRDGKEIWKVEAPAKAIEGYHKTLGSPASAACAIDGERVISYFGSCGLFCYDLNGKFLWKHELPTAQTNNDFGSGTSPIIAEGKVFLARDLAKDSVLIALDAKTGQPVWTVKRDGFSTCYATPILWKSQGKTELVVAGSLRMKAYDPNNGKEIWTIRDLPAVTCTTPVVANDLLVFAGWSPGDAEESPLPAFAQFALPADADGDGALNAEEAKNTFLSQTFENNDLNHDGKFTEAEWEETRAFLAKGTNRVFAVRPGGTGDISDTHVVWTRGKGLPYVPSPVFCQDRVFMIRHGGLATLLDSQSGKPIYEMKRIGQEGDYFASPVTANGFIYLAGLNGVMSVLKAGDKLDVVSTTDLGEQIFATPAIVGDILYVRTAGHMYAFGDAPKR